MFDPNQDSELTNEPLSGVPPASAANRRNQERHVTVLRVAKLSTPRSEEFCLVRNISAGGMMAHIYSELEIGDPVRAEISGQPISGKILWRREGVAGIGFDESVNPSSILTGVDRPPIPQRAPRVGIEVRARIRIGAQYRFVTLCNISQGGASISPPEPGELGEKLVLMANGLPPISGVVRWQDQEHAGIKFDVPLSFDVLAKWVPTLRR